MIGRPTDSHVSLCVFTVCVPVKPVCQRQLFSPWTPCRRNSKIWRKKTNHCDLRYMHTRALELLRAHTIFFISGSHISAHVFCLFFKYIYIIACVSYQLTDQVQLHVNIVSKNDKNPCNGERSDKE